MCMKEQLFEPTAVFMSPSDVDVMRAVMNQLSNSEYKPSSMVIVVRPMWYKNRRFIKRINRKPKKHFRK